MSGKYLDRETILGADDLPWEDMEVPEWGGTIHVVGLTATEREELLTNYNAYRARGLTQPALAAMAIKDEQGQRLFSLEDVEALGRKSGNALDRVFSVAQRLSGLGREAAETISKN